MPAAPDLGGGEHSTATAHVSEGTLAGTVSTTTWHTRDTGNSAASTPGLSGGLVTGATTNGVGLAAVFGDVGVDKGDDVRTDGGFHNIGERDGVSAVGGHIRL